MCLLYVSEDTDWLSPNCRGASLGYRPSMSASPANVAPTGVRWHFTTPALLFVIVAIGIAVVPFINALSQLVDLWNISPEYSHGILIPPIAALLVWRQREWLARTPFEGAWTGLLRSWALVCFCGWWVSSAPSSPSCTTASCWCSTASSLLLTGWKVFRRLWMPLLILVFMISAAGVLCEYAVAETTAAVVGHRRLDHSAVRHQRVPRRQRHRSRKLSAAGCVRLVTVYAICSP